MDLSGLPPSASSEHLRGQDSALLATDFLIEFGLATYGRLTSADPVDFFRIDTGGGRYRLLVTSDPAMANSVPEISSGWGRAASAVQVRLLNSQGATLISESSTLWDNWTDQINFIVPSGGRFYVEVRSTGVSEVAYAATLQDLSPPVAPKLVPRADIVVQSEPQVTLSTTAGAFSVSLAAQKAPGTVANFLAYVEDGFYNGTVFHRVIPRFVVQGGGFEPGLLQRQVTYAPIALETGAAGSNLRGTLAMARTSAADSATSQFFINLVDNAFPTPGYAVFGEVTRGMAVIDAIALQPTGQAQAANGLLLDDVPNKDILLTSATLSAPGFAVGLSAAFDLVGLEPGARWSYSLDGGAQWFQGAGGTLSVPAGSYPAGSIRVRQTDASGQTSLDTNGYASVLQVDPAFASLKLNVQAYAWRSHAMLSGVELHVGDEPGSALTTTDASGQAKADFLAKQGTRLTAEKPIEGSELVAASVAVDLQDAITILKLIVGLDVNGSGRSLSPYQSIAADFDGDGRVSLVDAIGVLKHVVGLPAPAPTWRFVTDADPSVPAQSPLSPGKRVSATLDPAGNGSWDLSLVGVLSGDVDGDLASNPMAAMMGLAYFQKLTSDHQLSLTQFGIYGD